MRFSLSVLAVAVCLAATASTVSARPRPQAAGADPCAGLFKSNMKLRFTRTTHNTETLGYATAASNTRIPSQTGIDRPIFVTEGMVAPTDVWTITMAGDRQFRMQNDENKYLAICSKALTGAPLSGFYPELKPAETPAGPKNTWKYHCDPAAPTVCRVAIENVSSQKRITVCTSAQCGTTTGMVQKCPAVVAATDNSFLFVVTDAQPAAAAADEYQTEEPEYPTEPPEYQE